MIREAIEKVVGGIDLSEAEARRVFEEIMSGSATAAQIGTFAALLRMKGETVEEITGAAAVMREKAVRIDLIGRPAGTGNAGIDAEPIIDTCGTGGSGVDTFNISTTVAFVLAGSGLKVAKHGNRGVSSRCGSADVLEALGLKIDTAPDIVKRCILEIGIGFIFAPLFHDAMKYALTPRREIGIRTIFNVLGPLSNPARPTCQILGVYDAKLTEVMARVLKNLGVRRAFVVHGTDGLDEITIAGKTKVSELKSGRIKTYYVSPENFGLKRSSLEGVRGAAAKENADIITSILNGETGPRRDIVLLNAGAGLVCGLKAPDFRAGVKLAAESIDSGRALDKLRKLIKFTNGATM